MILQHRIKSPYSMWKKMEKKKVRLSRCVYQPRYPMRPLRFLCVRDGR